MSAAAPMDIMCRRVSYNPHARSEWDLTPAQRRRMWHKALRSGERSADGSWDLQASLGRKCAPTPRQRVRKPKRPYACP